MNALRNLGDRFFGRGDYSVSVPPMDGALQPNQQLDKARLVYQGEQPDNLCAASDNLYFSDGAQLFKLSTAGATPVGDTFKANILTLCAYEQGLVIVLDNGSLWLGTADALKQVDVDPKLKLAHATAICSDASGSLLVCIGSSHNSVQDWTKDLMERRHAGSVWRITLAGGSAVKLLSGLAWPAGILSLAGKVYISEAWRHRIISLENKIVQLAQLPGYPGKLMTDNRGGAILSVFAPRSQLIELVLRHPVYRRRMMEEVPQPLWVAPAYSSGNSFLEPLQGGGVKQMGILKPWAPSRSYGLAVQLNNNLQPTASLHSRADGKRHGICSAIRHCNNLLATSRGSGELIAMPIEELA